MSAQDQAIEPARKILELTAVEQIRFINASLEQGLPESRADQMTMLVINRSSITLPLVEEKIEEALKHQSPPQRFVDTAAELIAYAGDEQALYAIVKLIRIDEARFARLVGRALTHCANWRNPFTLAYRGLQMGDEAVARSTTTWAKAALTSNRMQRAWAEAMIAEYGRVPGDGEWANDPIASRIRPSQRQQLKENVLRFARKRVRSVKGNDLNANRTVLHQQIWEEGGIDNFQAATETSGTCRMEGPVPQEAKTVSKTGQ